MKYEKHIHNKNKDEGKNGYDWFLCKSSLFSNEPISEFDKLPSRTGSYHLIHWIDDKLVAVSVLDITPSVLSSVYLFYDPDYQHLNLGTFCAIKEIEYLNKI